MLLSESITLAIHQPSAKIIHIDNALNGLACNCVCQECGGILEAIQGKKGKNILGTTQLTPTAKVELNQHYTSLQSKF